MTVQHDSPRHFTAPEPIAAAWAALTRWRVGLLVIGLFGLTVGAVVQLLPGINPDSLWLDDQWVAVLVQHASLSEVLELRAPVPPGFVLLLKASTAVLGAGAWSLQVLPMIAGLAMIPAVGWIAFRLTDRVSLGLFAAGLLAGSRTLAVFSLRIKQFTLEGLIVLLLIALAMICLRRMRGWTFWPLLAAAVAAMAFSFTAAAMGLVAVNTIALHALLTGRDQMRIPRLAVIAGCAAYDLIVLAWLGLYQSGHANDLIVEFWHGYYLPLNDVAALWSFLRVQLTRFLTGAVPSTLSWLAIGVPVGIVLLWVRKDTRLIGVALLLFYGGMLLASAAQLYPLGGRRTDIFSYPVTVLTITAAIWALSRWVRFLPGLALAVLVVEIILFYPEPSVTYPPRGGRSAIEMVNDMVGDGDGLILAPRATWAMGCYGRWPVHLQRADTSSNGYVAEIARPHTLLLREAWWGMDPAEGRRAVLAQIEPFLDGAPESVFFVSIRGPWPAHEWIAQALLDRGYAVQSLPAPAGGAVQLFVRRGEERDP